MSTYYETGSAPDINNLLGKLRTAMAANGWTVNYNDLEGSSGGYRCHMTKDGMTVNLRTGFNNEVPVSVTAERSARQGTWRWNYTYGSPAVAYRPNWLAFNVSTGVNLSRSWHNQPGGPGSTELKGLASMITCTGAISRYWLFILDSPDTVVLIAETRPNKFEHIAFGRMDLCQDIQAGGEWFCGSRRFNDHYSQPNEFAYGLITPTATGVGTGSMFRVVDTRWTVEDQLDGWNQGIMTPGVPNSYGSSAFWALVGIPTPDSTVSNPSSSTFHNLINSAYLELEGRSILHTIGCWKYMLNGGLTLIGTLPHFTRTSLRAYVAGDPIAGVGDTYLAFPGHERLSPWDISTYGSSPSNPADESYNYYGTGIGIRRP